MTIKTKFDYPPIPSREWDWIAWDEETYDAESGNIVGHGSSEEEAINDLKSQYED